MHIIQLCKDFKTVSLYHAETDVYFLRLTKFKSKNGSQNHQFNSKRLIDTPIGKINEYIDDPDVVLIQVWDDDAWKEYFGRV